jgi:hypothetical protein
LSRCLLPVIHEPLTDEEEVRALKKGGGRHLTELLVAGVVIAGLAIAIITIDLRATGRARELLCCGNVHQLTLAVQQYTDDHDGRLPPGPNWQMLSLAYVQTTEDPKLSLLSCPSRSADPGFATGLNYDVAGRRADGVSKQVWLMEVYDGSPEIWWSNDINFHRLRVNRFPVGAHRGRTTYSRGDGSVRTKDAMKLSEADWLPPPVEDTTLY